MVRSALRTNAANLALGSEVLVAGGATFVRNRAAPAIRDANFVTHVAASTPAEIERLLARAEREYAGAPHRRFDTDFTTAPAFEARLALDGYTRSDALVMLLEGDLLGDAPAHDIRLVVDDAGWRALEEMQATDWKEYIGRTNQPDDELPLGAGSFLVRRAKCPPVRYWLAYLAGEPRGYLSSWGGIDGVGQVEDLAVQTAYRHGGLATALLQRCVADCRDHGAGPVVIVCDPTDTPKRMYAAMGWRPAAIKREWRLDVRTS